MTVNGILLPETHVLGFDTKCSSRQKGVYWVDQQPYELDTIHSEEFS